MTTLNLYQSNWFVNCRQNSSDCNSHLAGDSVQELPTSSIFLDTEHCCNLLKQFCVEPNFPVFHCTVLALVCSPMTVCHCHVCQDRTTSTMMHCCYTGLCWGQTLRCPMQKNTPNCINSTLEVERQCVVYCQQGSLRNYILYVEVDCPSQ